MKANKCQHALFKIQQRYYEYGLQVVNCRFFLSYVLDIMKLKHLTETGACKMHDKTKMIQAQPLSIHLSLSYQIFLEKAYFMRRSDLI